MAETQERETVMASELLKQLQAAITAHGDLPVYLRDPDTRWPMRFELDPEAKELRRDFPELPPCMAIVADY